MGVGGALQEGWGHHGGWWRGRQGQDGGGKWGQPFMGPSVSVGLGLNSFHKGFQEEVLVSRAG